MQNRNQTKKIFNQSCDYMPGGVNSPVRACSEMGQLPMVIDHAFEDLLIDVDGHTYIDFCGSWGALIHGHAHKEILDAVYKRMIKGTSFGITSVIETEMANQLIRVMDSIERVRFVSSGTEATMSAVRLARGFTKRPLIIKFNGNYHGHADFFLVRAGSGVFNLSPTSSSAGIPEEIIKWTMSLPYNDIEACKKIFENPDYKNQIAAVILEPIAANMGVVPATKEFIQFLREQTMKIGSLLIFDEVITGFRIGLKGAQDYFNVKADLVCFGKIIGGGFPVAAFGGRKDVMDYLAPLGPVYQAGTLSGNPVAMEAGFQALKLVQKEGFYDELQRKTDILIEPIKALIQKKKISACIQDIGSMFTLFFGINKAKNQEDVKRANQDLFARFFRYMFENGVYIPPSQHEAWFISQAHTDKNLAKTRDLIIDFLESIK